MDRKLFGTDGIRGIANKYPMTAEVALRLGRAISHVFRERQKKGVILIGKDTRLSGYMFETAITSGICSTGCDAILLGPMPTAGIAFLTKTMMADAGIVISASHNPYEYNGIKIFSKDGFKLSDEIEYEIERYVMEEDIEPLTALPEEMGKVKRLDDAKERYVTFLKDLFPHSLRGFRIVLDCANGATYKVAPAVFEALGADVIPFGIEPDGLNINRDCGTEYPSRIKRLMEEYKGDVGIAFDGDGDRVIFVDEEGELINGDMIMAITASFLKQKSLLKKDTIVTTILSNMGLEEFLRERGIKTLRTKVGDRYVLEEMLREDLNFGGERSGHIVLLDYTTTGDGILTALKVLEIIKEKGKGLSELKAGYFEYPQIERKVPVNKKRPIEDIPELVDTIRDVKDSLGKEGRVIVRYSGTEALLRIMVEGKEEKRIKSYADFIEDVAKRYLGGR